MQSEVSITSLVTLISTKIEEQIALMLTALDNCDSIDSWTQ